MGLLNSLGCRIIHSIPYHPQSKDIERFFGTLENKFICHLKGWCYNNVQDRPADFGKKHQAMLGKREFFWFDEFVNLFATEILPAYHGTPDDPREHPDLDGWLLSFESMSPAQRYTTLEKARTVIPDWKTMSILKQHYYPEKPLVRSNGIRFQNTYYKDDALAGIVGDHVSILCHAFTPPYAPASITVIHNGKAICEAYPVIRNSFTDESPSVLSEASDTQNRPVREMKKAVSRINRSANAILPENCKEPVPTRKDQLREYTSGQTPLEEIGDQDLSAINKAMASITDGSSHASRAAYDKAYTMLFGAYDMLLFDNVSIKKDSDIEKLESLRKINEFAKIPIVFSGVQKLYDDLYDDKKLPQTCSIVSRMDEFHLTGMTRKDAGMYLAKVAEAENYSLTYPAQQALIETALNTTIGGINAFVTILGRCITMARATYYTSDGRTLPDKAKCVRPAVPDDQEYPGAELIITPPVTPDKIVIDEYLVSRMQSEYKTHFPKLEKKKGK